MNTLTAIEKMLKDASKSMTERDYELFSLILVGYTNNEEKARFLNDAKKRGLI